jgi:DNA ligase D
MEETAGTAGVEPPEGVAFTHLDEALFDGAGATKGNLVEYLDAVHDEMLAGLTGRALSVVRVHRGDDAFMQKNLPRYAPDWIERVEIWAETSKREVAYALCNDRRTVLWFANQRAVEYHPALTLAASPEQATHLVVDLDPPGEGAFGLAVRVAQLVRRVLGEAGLDGAVKTSGAKGLHIVVPVEHATSVGDAAAATRAIAERAAVLEPDLATTEFVKAGRHGRVFVDSTRAGSATVVAAFSPRVRPGVPVSFPLRWDELHEAAPGDFTLHSAPERLQRNGNPWADELPAPQRLPAELVAEGHAIPVGRVQAMHEGLRRARARRV